MTENSSDAVTTSRPTTQQQLRGRVVLRVENFVLATKVVVVSIFEVLVQNSPSSPLSSASRPRTSGEKAGEEAAEAGEGDSLALATLAGFYVTAVDEVENAYSLYISKAKAAYLHRSGQEGRESEIGGGGDGQATGHQQQPAAEAMAASILAHLDIIGNRHRDIGKLTCREPQVHVTRKARIVPTKTSSTKPKNAHVQSKRQDQRAARALLTAVKARAAIASGRKPPLLSAAAAANTDSEDEALTPRTRKARKSSEYRLLSRLAVADSKSIWKSELETIHDDPSYRALVDKERERPSPMRGLLAKTAVVASKDVSDGDSDRVGVSSLSTSKPRAVPEKNGKYKELQERRDKGRDARLRVTRATSSSAIPEHHDGVDEVTAVEESSTQAVRAATFEEIDGQPGHLVKCLPSLGGSSRRSLLSPSGSTASVRPPMLVRNSFSRQPPELEPPQEPEQFLRKRSDAPERRVLKEEGVFNEIPGMGVEITTERPKGRGSLLGSPRLDDVRRLEKLRMQENARRSSLVRDANGNLRRRSSVDRTALRKHSLGMPQEMLVALAVSPSAPELYHHDITSTETTPLGHTTAQGLLLSTTTESIQERRLKHDDAGESRLQCGGEMPRTEDDGGGSAELFKTTRTFVADREMVDFAATADGGQIGQTESGGDTEGGPGTLGLRGIDNDRLQNSLRKLELQPGQESEPAPLSSRKQQQQGPTFEIAEEAVDERDTVRDAVSLEVSENEIHDPAQQRQERSSATVASQESVEASSEQSRDRIEENLFQPASRQACWTEESPVSRVPSASPRTLAPIAVPPSTGRRELLPSLSPFPGESSVCEVLSVTISVDVDDELNTRSSDKLQLFDPAIGVSTAETPTDVVIGEKNEPSETSEEEAAGALVEKATSGSDEIPYLFQSQISTNDVAVHSRSPPHTETSEGEEPRDDSFSDDGQSMEASELCRESLTEEDADDGDACKGVQSSEETETVGITPTEPDAVYEVFQREVNSNRLEEAAGEVGNRLWPSQDEPVAAGQPSQTPTDDSGDGSDVESELASDHSGAELNGSALEVDTSTANAAATAASESPQRSRRSKTLEVPLSDTRKAPPSRSPVPSSKGASSPLASQSKDRGSATSGATTVSEARGRDVRRKSGASTRKLDTADTTSTTIASHITRRGSSKPSPRKLSAKDPTAVKVDANDGNGASESPTAAAAAATTASGSVRSMAVKHEHAVRKKRSAASVALLHASPQYHKKWGKWLPGRLVVDKLSCLQLEELVLQNPSSEKHLVKLGARYARWSATSLAAIVLLEHASLLHASAPRTHEYWSALGNAHLDLFLRHRKFLPVSKFHLDKCLQAFSRAFAYMESMADPLLLLRYAICLFWRSSDADLEKADDVFRELFAKFASFCDKDRVNLLFLRFQTLARLHMHREAAECMETIIQLYAATPDAAAPMDSGGGSSAPSPYDAADYSMMLMHCQQSSGDYVLASSTFSTVLERKCIAQDGGSLSDEQYLELWFSLAEKCFAHEEYPLALEFYSIALSFARDSHALASIHYSRGLCYEAANESAKCVAEFKRARNANRHVVPLVAVSDLRAAYDEQFAAQLKKPIRQIIDEVRLTLYDRAVKQLQRMFRRKQAKQHRADAVKPAKSRARSPSLSVADARARRRNSVYGQQLPLNSVAAGLRPGIHEQQLGGEHRDGDGIGWEGVPAGAPAPKPISQQERFVARQSAAEEHIRRIQRDQRFHDLSSPAALRASSAAKKAKSMPSEMLAQRSGLLSPARERPELRRKQSMDAFNKVQ